MTRTKKLGAESKGTFRLVLGGCGSAALAASFPEVQIGFRGLACTHLTVVAMTFAIGAVLVGTGNWGCADQDRIPLAGQRRKPITKSA